MRTNRRQFNKFSILTFFLFIFLLLTACDYEKVKTPVADTNPVIFTSTAEKKNVNVKDLNYIGPEGGLEDIVDGVYIDKGWIKITHLINGSDKSQISIEVTENLTVDQRTYRLYLYGKYGPHSVLKIIQAGKS